MTRRKRFEALQSLLFLVCVIGIWEAAADLLQISPLLVPAPSKIAIRAFELVASGEIWPHFLATLTSILSGLGIGIGAGLAFGATVSLLPWFERLIYPYLVALQSIPKVAIAPLFVLWFGYGILSKIVVTALVCFFPVLVSVIAGFQATDRDQLDMMRAFGASRWQMLRRLRIPAALVLIFAGIEIAAVLAVIGSIVGEFVGAQSGLGYLITAMNFSLDVPGVFAVLVFLSVIGMVLHGLVKLIGKRTVFWIHRGSSPLIG